MPRTPSSQPVPSPSLQLPVVRHRWRRSIRHPFLFAFNFLRAARRHRVNRLARYLVPERPVSNTLRIGVLLLLNMDRTDTPPAPLEPALPPALPPPPLEPQSRRLRLLGYVKTTRIATSIALFASEASNATLRAVDARGDPWSSVSGFGLGFNTSSSEIPLEQTIQEAQILLYPSYTRMTEYGHLTTVKGWVYAPGSMTRKNRLLMGVVRQLVRLGGNSPPTATSTANGTLSPGMQPVVAANPLPSSRRPDSQLGVPSAAVAAAAEATTDHYVHEFDRMVDNNATGDDLQLLLSTSSEALLTGNASTNSGSTSFSNTTEELLTQRMAAFIARSLSSVELEVVVGSSDVNDHERLALGRIRTDPSGHFSIDLHTPYTPVLVHVSCVADETVFVMEEPNVVPPTGVLVISDIDDTVKKTGVVGDKRLLFHTVFGKTLQQWVIPGVSEWYCQMAAHGARFHYVSNSPWQLYDCLYDFLQTTGFPSGSMHLKQYSGNLFASFTEPLVERKRRTLRKLMKDFPDRKFICIGDLGEFDLEAYVEVAKLFPGQVVGIYIRCVPSLLLLFSDNDTLVDIERMLRVWKARPSKMHSATGGHSNVSDLEAPTERLLPTPPTHNPEKLGTTAASTAGVAGDAAGGVARSANKVAPLVPRKPAPLRSAPSLSNAKESPQSAAPGPTVVSAVPFSVTPAVASSTISLATPPPRPAPRRKPPLPPRPAPSPLPGPPSRAETPSHPSPASIAPADLTRLATPPPLPPRRATTVELLPGTYPLRQLPVTDRTREIWLSKLHQCLDGLDNSIDIRFYKEPLEVEQASEALITKFLTHRDPD